MSKRDKYQKRLMRFLRLGRQRGFPWISYHIDREAVNARNCYQQVMRERISVKLARVGLVCAVMVKVDDFSLGEICE